MIYLFSIFSDNKRVDKHGSKHYLHQPEVEAKKSKFMSRLAIFWKFIWQTLQLYLNVC